MGSVEYQPLIIQECVGVLIRGCMFELSYTVGKRLNCSSYLLNRAAELLSLRCQKHNNWYVLIISYTLDV